MKLSALKSDAISSIERFSKMNATLDVTGLDSRKIRDESGKTSYMSLERKEIRPNLPQLDSSLRQSVELSAHKVYPTINTARTRVNQSTMLPSGTSLKEHIRSMVKQEELPVNLSLKHN